MTSFFSMTRALVARKRKIFALFFALAASIGLSWAQNLSGECGPELTWEFEEATGKLTISGTGTMLDYPYWKNEGLNSRITSVSLPEGLTVIGPYVFANCEYLESITLPSGLTSIGYGAFMNCIALREITLPGSLTTLEERAFENCEKLESIKLPEGITTLRNEVFAHCNHLQSVTLPPSLTTLGEDVFRECSRLESITLPDGLTSIGNNAFSGCHYLASITLPEGVTSIGSSAFEYCGFESIKLPDGITTLRTGVFSNCNRLQSVTLPPSLTSIGDWAFSGCWNLASVTLPAGVTTIGEEAFSYCTSLTEFTNKAATPQTISANVFSEVTLSNITLNVPGTSKAAYEAADVWKDFGTKATLPAAITKTITDNGMTYDIYDNGVVKVSGTGIVAARIFAANDHDYVTSVKRFEFADDCKVYSFGENWYMYYTSYSPLEAVDIKTTLPFVAGRESVFYRKGSDESVTVTITAPAIASITKKFVANYGTPQHIIFNMPVTTFEKSWCSYLREIDTVTIPTGSLYHLPASYVFKDESTQFNYDYMAADGNEDMFWQYEGPGLVEGVDYTRTEEETGVITAENETKVFGKAVVKYQAPQEAPATSWTFWRSDDFKTFPELVNGSSHTCKDVTLKIVDGSFMLGSLGSYSFITLSTSATNGIQLIAPKGKIFKQVIALDRDLRTSLIWTGEADTVGISSNLMQISLIEFELDAAPALPEAVTGLVYTGEAQTLIAAGEAAGYTFQYKVGENGEYSADLPTATDAGSYTVYYKATAAGEQDITGSLEVSIAKADINLDSTVTWNNDDITETGSESCTKDGITMNVTGYFYDFAEKNFLGGTFTSSVGNFTKIEVTTAVVLGNMGSGWTNYDSDNKSIWTGTPSSTVSFGGSDYWDGIRGEGEGVTIVFTLTPASVTLPQAVKGLIANGEAKTLITAGACENGTLYYSLDKENWSTDLPTGTGAQDYTVYYYVKGDANHNDSKVNSLTASIGTLPQALLGLVYTGEAKTLVTAGEVAGFTYQYKIGDAEYSTDLPTAINAGTYTVAYKATAEGEQDITGSVNVSIAKADINVNGGGALKGNFSVADGKAIYFSQGNLQATTADLGENWTWAFAANQYDYVGNAVANTKVNGNGTVSENGTVDLFGWSTATTKYGIHNSNNENNYSGDFVDWGATMGEGWFTLSTEQWTYLFDARTGDKAATVNSVADCTYTKATINTDGTAVKGIILFPDGGTFAASEFTEVGSPNTANANYTTTCTTEQWNALQAKGCVFLPVTGYRYFTSVSRAGDSYGFCGYYWSSTSNSGTNANLVYFAENVVDPMRNNRRNNGYSVRLVTEIAPASSVTLPQAVEELVYTSEKQALITAGECADGTFLYSTDNTNWVDTLPKVTDAGTYQVYYKIQGDANHNDYIAAEPIEVSIAKAALTITAENKEVVYGFAAPGFSVSYYGLKGSDLPANVLTGELSYACDYTVGSNVASYDITPSGQTSANYDITYVKGTLVVYKADPAFTAPTANTLTYNGGAQTLIAAGTTEHGTFEYTFTPNDDESWSTALPQAKNADTYGVYYRVVGDANHLDYESADAVVVTIAKAALTATADNKSVIYGDDVPEYTVTYEGWQGEDNADVLYGTIAYACEYAPTSNVGDYTITPSGVSNPNYAITFVNGKVTVSKAALTITADNKEVTYGDEAPAFTASYEGWKNEDDETVVSGLTLTSEYVLTSNVGEYDIVPANATAQNYAITFVNGTLTVNRAALMITAEDKEVTYGDEAPAFTASYEGWKNADDESVVSGLTLTSEYVLTSNVGEYDIVPANAEAQNYAISYTNGTLTVNKAPLMITAEDKEVTYGDEHPAFTASYEGFKNEDDESVVSGLTLTSEYVLTSNVGEYDIVPANAEAQNYAISYTNGTLTVNQAPLTITAEDKTIFYGNEAPEFTVTYAGWKNEDDESVVSGLDYTCEYQPGSYIGAYSIEPNSATAQNYAITFVDGTLTVNQAAVIVSGAKVQVAKFEDGTTDAVILDKGILNGVKLNDPVDHITTATFSDATVGEHKTIRVNYELTGDAALLANYDLILTAEDYIEEGIIIENFVPAEEGETEKEDEEAQIEEGIEVYAYGYCDGSGYSLRYHLNSGNPDQYKIDFDDSRFTDVDWTNLETPGKDGTIDINIPVDLPTGDYTFTATFRDSRFTWLPSNPFTVTFHVNLPETYVVALFDNVMAVVDTCECLTDIQWYWRANSTDQWQAIEGATGYYYKQEGGLSGEYFIKAKMNGVDTYTCSQDDMTLYGDDKQAKVSAYPNPVVNTTTVTIENSRLYEHKLRIVNLMGIEMMTTSFEGNTTSVEMGTFPQGHYMISVDGIVVKVMKK